jgi:hypothetical protein
MRGLVESRSLSLTRFLYQGRPPQKIDVVELLLEERQSHR